MKSSFFKTDRNDFGFQVQPQQTFNPFKKTPQTEGPLKNTKGRKQARFSAFDQPEFDPLKPAEDSQRY